MVETKVTDISGQVIKVGDIVAFGHDNGSTLELGKVYKITPRKVWMYQIENGVTREDYTRCRDHLRVAKVAGQ